MNPTSFSFLKIPATIKNTFHVIIIESSFILNEIICFCVISRVVVSGQAAQMPSLITQIDRCHASLWLKGNFGAFCVDPGKTRQMTTLIRSCLKLHFLAKTSDITSDCPLLASARVKTDLRLKRIEVYFLVVWVSKCSLRGSLQIKLY